MLFSATREILNAVDSASTQVPYAASKPTTEIEALKADVERLLIISEALWRILKEKHGLDEQEIVRQITLIDMEDGKLDGRKAKSEPQPCPKCGRITGKQRLKCMFCGEFLVPKPFDR
jgi:hypothetical protein